MAKLRIPENCSACGVVLMEHDQVIFEREATLVTSRVREWQPSSDAFSFGQYVFKPVLQPKVKPTSPRNVRHKVCP